MIPIASPTLGYLEKQHVLKVMGSGQLAAGTEVRRLEDEFADFCGTAHAVATNNGTTALHAALEACGIGEGDRVITTPFSFIATANAIHHCGATPVFADIDPETYTLDPEAVERTIDRFDGNVEAVLVVHLYGLPADMDRLAELCEAHDLLLVEDAAQAHGAAVDGRRVGSIGDAGCFSFYPTKNMTTGEGGMVVTDREDVARRAARLVDHGRTDDATHTEVGYNYRMTEIAAAIGRIQLERLPEFTDARREHASRLAPAVDESGLGTPIEPDGRTHVYHQFTVRTAARERFRAHLEDAGVGTAIYYPTPIHRQPAYDDYDGSYPVAERAANEVVSLPVHPALSDEDVETIRTAVMEFDDE
jgi:dTDP-4-amino-4,6-dideoxygalactose transaminase